MSDLVKRLRDGITIDYDLTEELEDVTTLMIKAAREIERLVGMREPTRDLLHQSMERADRLQAIVDLIPSKECVDSMLGDGDSFEQVDHRGLMIEFVKMLIAVDELQTEMEDE